MNATVNKTVSVAAIENGTVIDHVPCGQAFRLIQLLGLQNEKNKLTVGLNLPSKRMVLKDILKIENYHLTKKQANEITIFAPQATINIIKEFAVVEKVIASLPKNISNVFVCPNPACITHVEPIEGFFTLEEHGKQVNLICKYCEKVFNRNQAKVKI